LLLNYKKIGHITQWVQYPDIKPLFLSLGVPPSGKDAQGEDAFTCPAIQVIPTEGSKPIFVTDSLKIAEFLEERYPNTPTVFKNVDKAIQLDTIEKVLSELVLPLASLVPPWTLRYMPEESVEYYRLTREKRFGCKIEEMYPDETTLETYRASTKKRFNEFLQAHTHFGPFLYGEEISYSDMVLASVLLWFRTVANSEMWSHIKEWDDGRWEKYLNSFEEKGYTKVY
jgi:glutathione S-transferase